jgi:glyoxylase-like metal-dependent hydrolase (beta-lactamase superfamily II)
VVDSATQPAAVQTILPYLTAQALPRAGQSVLVVNSHCHCDHIGGNAALQATLGAEIVVHQADADLVESRSLQLEVLFGPFRGYADLAVDPEAFLALAGADTPVDHRLVDGDTLDLGKFRFEVIHTPGHSAGSIALYEPAHGLLLVGDAVQGHGTTDTLVPLIVDLPAYRRSLRRLAELEVAVLVVAHPFPPHTEAILGPAAARRLLLDSEVVALDYLERTARLLSAQVTPLTLWDLSRRLAAELDLPTTNRYLLMVVAACLDELITQGVARRLSGCGPQPDGWVCGPLGELVPPAATAGTPGWPA